MFHPNVSGKHTHSGSFAQLRNHNPAYAPHPLHTQQGLSQEPAPDSFHRHHLHAAGPVMEEGHTPIPWGKGDVLVISPEELTPQGDLSRQTSWNTDFSDSSSGVFPHGSHTSTVSTLSTEPFGTGSMDLVQEIVPLEAMNTPDLPDLPYLNYLRGLSDQDLSMRLNRHHKKAITLNDKLLSQSNSLSAMGSPEYIRNQEKFNKHYAEFELANAEMLRRNICSGLASPKSPKEQEELNAHFAHYAAVVDHYWQQQEKPPALKPETIRFLTLPHGDPYFRYLQDQTDAQLQHRYGIYKKGTRLSKLGLEEDLKRSSGPTRYGHRAFLSHLSIPGGPQAEIVKPIVGRSIFAPEELQKLKAQGRYRAEAYLARAELYRRQINRGVEEIPSRKEMKTILDNIDEYLCDIETDFNPQSHP